jgi:hypothetical protein
MWSFNISELDDFDSLVRTYQTRLLRLVTSFTGDQDLAATIVQDCFLKAYWAREKFRGDCSISTWLHRIALNVMRDYQRLQKPHFWKLAGLTAVDLGDSKFSLLSHEPSPETPVSGTIPGETDSGLGPAYNSNSCASCHSQPATGGTSPATNPQIAAATADGATNTIPDFISAGGPVREPRFPFQLNSNGTLSQTPDGGVHDV